MVEAGHQLDAGTGARRGLAAADDNHDNDDNHDHNNHDASAAGSPEISSCIWQSESLHVWRTPLRSGDVERRPPFDIGDI